MDPIDNVRRSLELLRQQRAQKTAKSQGASETHPIAAAAQHPHANRSARQSASRKIQALSRDDPAYHEKAINAFIESVLASEFGEGLVNDPEFQDMVKEIQSAMTADAELSAQLRQLVDDIAATR